MPLTTTPYPVQEAARPVRPNSTERVIAVREGPDPLLSLHRARRRPGNVSHGAEQHWCVARC